MTDRDRIIRDEWIGAGIMLLGIAAVFLVIGLDLHPFWIVIGFAVSIAGVIYCYRKVRCPHCDSILVTRGGFPDYCSHCGKKIE